MNTQTPTPGYVVEAQYWEQPDRNTTKSFVDADLLTARQSAMHHAQRLAAQKLPTEVLTVEIYLTEFDSQQIVLSYLTRVCVHRFHRSQYIDEGEPQSIEMVLAPGWIADQLPPSINLTVDLTRDDSAFNSIQAVWDSLEEITYELEYYHTHRHRVGFGYVLLDEIGPYPPLPEAHKLLALPDPQLRQHLLKLQESQALHCRSFTVLYEGFTYASSLIHNYNQHYAAEEERLSFRTEFFG